VTSIPGKIVSWKGPNDPTLLTESGKIIIQGLIDGLEAKKADVIAVLQRLTHALAFELDPEKSDWLSNSIDNMLAELRRIDIAIVDQMVPDSLKALALLKLGLDDAAQAVLDALANPVGAQGPQGNAGPPPGGGSTGPGSSLAGAGPTFQWSNIPGIKNLGETERLASILGLDFETIGGQRLKLAPSLVLTKMAKYRSGT